MLNLDNPNDALVMLQKLMDENKFEFAPRSKSHVISSLAKVIIENLTINDFKEFGFDHNGSRDLVFIFISDDDVQYSIKFKFKNNGEIVKFISFHEVEYK